MLRRQCEHPAKQSSGGWQLRSSTAAFCLAKRPATGLGSLPNPTTNLAGILGELLHVPPCVFSLHSMVVRSATVSPCGAARGGKVCLRPLGNMAVSMMI